MKKILLISAALVISLGAYAFETPDNVVFKTACYALRMSPNGKWIANFTGYPKIYNVETDETTEYLDCTFSIGNMITNDGLAVAGGVFLKDGEIIPIRTPEGRGGFSVDGISSDGKYVTGSSGRGPFVGEVDENLHIINTVNLPYPSRDLFGARPQWVNALWISEDGNTVAGQIQDGYGMYLYPIIYYNSPEGWKYSLPTESLFNPEDLELYQNPSEGYQPDYPYPEDFMTGVEAALYQEAYRAYLNGSGIKPDPAKFMTEEEYNQYVAAVDKYNEWYNSTREQFNKFIESYYAIIETSPCFNTTELAIHPSGEFVYMNGGIYDNYGNRECKMYEMTKDGVTRVIDLIDNAQAPNQVLSDGTVMSSPPLTFIPNGYILLPGTDEFITLQDYLAPEYPELSLWLDETFPGGTGIVSMSDDKSIIAGGVFITQVSDEIYEDASFRFASYIIDLNKSGVESIFTDGQPADGIYRIFNLQGIKIMETKEKADIDKLPGGLYLINGKKIIK